MKAIAIALALLLAAGVLFTGWALESSGVAVIETKAADGTARSTHVWYAEPDGELWLEAGTPDNPWFRDVQEDPMVSFEAERRSGRYVVDRIANPAGHEKIRSLLRAKYGLRDWWVGLLTDTSGSIAVRLVSAEVD